MSRIAHGLTLVTVTYNSAQDLRDHWTSFDRGVARWIVVDNASADDSIEVARELGAEVIAMSENKGFGTACNVGFEASGTDVVGFVNPDVSVPMRDLEELAEYVRARGGLVAPQLLNSDGTLQPNGRGVPSLPNKIANRLWPARAIERGFARYAGDGQEMGVDWLTGAAIFATRETLIDVGGFDEHFFVYYEDVDLCLRARARGYSCTVNGNYKWLHAWARAAKGVNYSAWKLELSSAIRFYAKHPSKAFARGNDVVAEVTQ